MTVDFALRFLAKALVGLYIGFGTCASDTICDCIQRMDKLMNLPDSSSIPTPVRDCVTCHGHVYERQRLVVGTIAILSAYET